MATKRFTIKNPSSHPGQPSTYHVPMSWLKEFEMKTIGANTYMYGDLVNKLGKYEELGEPEELARKLGMRNV